MQSAPQQQELIVRLKAKDQSAFAMLYELHVDRTYAYVLSILKSTALADDVVQDVFVKLWTASALLDESKPLLPYLLTIARNQSLNVLRKAAKQQSLTDTIAQAALDSSENSEQFVERKQTAALLELAIEQLPDKRRAIYDMCHQNGYSYKQTADKLGIKYSTVNTQMVRALKHIKDYLLKNGALLLSLLIFVKR
jgi:RNA polymerase sigma-70 factor (ECF subfamily)